MPLVRNTFPARIKTVHKPQVTVAVYGCTSSSPCCWSSTQETYMMTHGAWLLVIFFKAFPSLASWITPMTCIKKNYSYNFLNFFSYWQFIWLLCYSRHPRKGSHHIQAWRRQAAHWFQSQSWLKYNMTKKKRFNYCVHADNRHLWI